MLRNISQFHVMQNKFAAGVTLVVARLKSAHETICYVYEDLANISLLARRLSVLSVTHKVTKAFISQQ